MKQRIRRCLVRAFWILLSLGLVFILVSVFNVLNDRHTCRAKLAKIASVRDKAIEVYGRDLNWDEIPSVDMAGLVATLGLDAYNLLEDYPGISDVKFNPKGSVNNDAIFYWRSSRRAPVSHFLNKAHYDVILMGRDGNIIWKHVLANSAE